MVIETSPHGIGQILNEINQEYQSRYNTTEQIFNLEGTDVTIERNNTTITVGYEGPIPTARIGASAANSRTGYDPRATGIVDNGYGLVYDAGNGTVDSVSLAGGTPTYVGSTVSNATEVDSDAESLGHYVVMVSSNTVASGAANERVEVVDCFNPYDPGIPESNTTAMADLNIVPNRIGYDESKELFVIVGEDSTQAGAIEWLDLQGENLVSQGFATFSEFARPTDISVKDGYVAVLDGSTSYIVDATDITAPAVIATQSQANTQEGIHLLEAGTWVQVSQNSYLRMFTWDSSGNTSSPDYINLGGANTVSVFFESDATYLNLFTSRLVSSSPDANRDRIMEWTNAGFTTIASTQTDVDRDIGGADSVNGQVLFADKQGGRVTTYGHS